MKHWFSYKRKLSTKLVAKTQEKKQAFKSIDSNFTFIQPKIVLPQFGSNFQNIQSPIVTPQHFFGGVSQNNLFSYVSLPFPKMEINLQNILLSYMIKNQQILNHIITNSFNYH